jgi:hypothetical protein
MVQLSIAKRCSNQSNSGPCRASMPSRLPGSTSGVRSRRPSSARREGGVDLFGCTTNPRRRCDRWKKSCGSGVQNGVEPPLSPVASPRSLAHLSPSSPGRGGCFVHPLLRCRGAGSSSSVESEAMIIDHCHAVWGEQDTRRICHQRRSAPVRSLSRSVTANRPLPTARYGRASPPVRGRR